MKRLVLALLLSISLGCAPASLSQEQEALGEVGAPAPSHSYEITEFCDNTEMVTGMATGVTYIGTQETVYICLVGLECVFGEVNIVDEIVLEPPVTEGDPCSLRVCCELTQ